MSIASVIFSRKPIVLLVAISLVGCSGDLTPSVGIDGESTVNAITPGQGAAAGRAMRAAGASTVAAYPAADMPLSTVDGRTREIDGAVTVGADAPAAQPEGRLPMIDSDEALGIGGVSQATAGSGPLLVPEEGVNMDAGLGVPPVQGLAEAQAEEIAEGNASQVVVDGIGSDTPQQIGEPACVRERRDGLHRLR